MQPAHRNCEFVADFAAKGARLGETQMMGVDGDAAADETRERCDKSLMLFIPQANDLAGDGRPRRALTRDLLAARWADRGSGRPLLPG
jgi:hypothetical protein